MSSLPLIPSVSSTPTTRSSATSTSTSTSTTPNPFGHTGFAEILSQIQTSKGQQYTTPVFDAVAGEEIPSEGQPAVHLVSEESGINAFTITLEQAAGGDTDAGEVQTEDVQTEDVLVGESVSAEAPDTGETEEPTVTLGAGEPTKGASAAEDAESQPKIATVAGDPKSDAKALKADSRPVTESAKSVPFAGSALTSSQFTPATDQTSATAFRQAQVNRAIPQQSTTLTLGSTAATFTESSSTTSATVTPVTSGDTEREAGQGRKQQTSQHAKVMSLVPVATQQPSVSTQASAQQTQVSSLAVPVAAAGEGQSSLGTSPQAAPVAPATSTSGQLAQAVVSSSAAAARANTVQQLAAPLRSSVVRGVEGTHTTVVKMSPESLGPVSIEATAKDGVVRIELIATTDAGRDAIRASLNDLRRELAGTGAQLDMGGNGNSSKETGQNSSRDGQRQSGPKSDLSHGENLAPQQFESNTDTEKGAASNGRLDIMA